MKRSGRADKVGESSLGWFGHEQRTDTYRGGVMDEDAGDKNSAVFINTG